MLPTRMLRLLVALFVVALALNIAAIVSLRGAGASPAMVTTPSNSGSAPAELLARRVISPSMQMEPLARRYISPTLTLI